MPTATRTQRLLGPAAAAGSVLLAGLALHLRDPHRSGSWGYCPFKLLTGWDCPGCGGLRSVNDLGNGHLAAAVHSNLLLVASLPLAIGLWALWLRARWTGRAPALGGPAPARFAAAYLVVALAFTVLRNTPWGAGLHAA